ncbi:MAG: ABC transporter permease [Bacteroidia bacterium]|nr:ABC transporter permease [Bacteroidia bacterium]
MNEKKYSQFSAMLAITRASLRGTLRSPSAVIFTLIFPLIFIIIFGFIRPGNIKLDVGVRENCDTTGIIFQSLKDIPNIVLLNGKSNEELEKLMLKGKLDALLSIRTDETKNPHGQVVDLTVSRTSRDQGAIIKSIVNNVIDKNNLVLLNKIIQQEKNIIPSDFAKAIMTAKLHESVLEGRIYRMIDFILPGQLGFSILSSGVFGTAFVFFSMRQTLVLKRFFATPIRRSNIIIGEGISRLLFQISGAFIIILVGKYAFDFTLVNGVQTVLSMILLSTLGLIVFMGFGFVISGIAPNESVIPPIANLVTLPQFLLSGTFFSTDAFPSWLQAVSKVLPLTHLNEALRKIAFEGASLSDVSFPIFILILWGIGIYALAVKFFRWE